MLITRVEARLWRIWGQGFMWWVSFLFELDRVKFCILLKFDVLLLYWWLCFFVTAFETASVHRFLTVTPVLDQSFHGLTDFLWYKLVGCLEHSDDVDIGDRLPKSSTMFRTTFQCVTYLGDKSADIGIRICIQCYLYIRLPFCHPLASHFYLSLEYDRSLKWSHLVVGNRE